MILEFKVKCDKCDKVINAKKEGFIDCGEEGEYEHLCEECFAFGDDEE
jgi:hypothetical protein